MNLVEERMASEFYLTLPSNSSMQYYPNNKTSSYITKIPTRLELNGEWEVGLAEIKYPHTWYNVREGKNFLEVFRSHNWFAKIKIKAGYYKSIKEVVKKIMSNGLKEITDVKLVYDDTSKRITIKCKNNVTVILKDDIARIFGFVTGTDIQAAVNRGFTLALPETGNQNLYVYTDIIRGQYYGDVVVPILQTVTVKGEHGTSISKHFERPHYIPLNKTNFDTIDINIRDEVGDLVAFEHGKVNITLHFRRSKTHYYI